MSVSVVIPTYNRAGYLVQAVESVLGQESFGGCLEVIVVDDGSTDETPKVLRGFGSRVVSLRIPHSGIPAVARNAGLAVATGRYVAFQDSDDLWMPGKLRRQLDLFRRDPDIVLAYGHCEFIEADGSRTGRLVWRPDLVREGQVFTDLLRGNFLSPSSVVAPRKSVEELGGFNESPQLIAREDYELWLRLAMLGPFGFEDEVLVLVRVHSNNLNRMSDAENVRRTIALYRAVLRSARGSNRSRILARLAEVNLSLWAERGKRNPSAWEPLLSGAWYRLRARLSALRARSG